MWLELRDILSGSQNDRAGRSRAGQVRTGQRRAGRHKMQQQDSNWKRYLMRDYDIPWSLQIAW